MLYESNPSRTTIPLIRPHQYDPEGGRIRGVLLYFLLTCCSARNFGAWEVAVLCGLIAFESQYLR